MDDKWNFDSDDERERNRKAEEERLAKEWADKNRPKEKIPYKKRRKMLMKIVKQN